MKFLKLLWRRYTLLCILALTAAPLMLLGWYGRGTIYSQYSLDPVREPALSLVFRGIHDGIYPWDILRREESDAADSEKEEETAAEIETAAGGDAASQAQTADGVTAQTADGVTAQAAQGQTAQAASAGETAAVTDGEDTVAAYEEAQDTSVEKIEALPANAIHADSSKIPEGCGNPVMQAADYDVVNVAFLSPDDTEYNTDTEGIFAKNGIYYALGPVEPSYFSDALFIGDSRTVGLCEYGTLKETASFLAKESVNVYNVLDQELRFTDTSGETWDATVDEILSDYTFGKVYVALGVNELGIGTTYMYYEKYREILELIREKQPDALIYIQGIMHVSEEKSRTDSCRNNTVISQRNGAISTLANGRDIFYIDMNPYVCDANGDLKEDMSGDGIHLKASAYENWDRFLMENAAVIGE